MSFKQSKTVTGLALFIIVRIGSAVADGIILINCGGTGQSSF